MRPVGERLNPVAVKDVRQSLRGKLFRVVFAANLSLATVVVLFTLIVVAKNSRNDSGVDVFGAGHGVYALCALVLVPLLANRSMASERDDHSLDALMISGLDTAAIVRGKSQSALVMLALFLSSTAPFLALGYTLHGLDVITSLAILAVTTVIGAGLCMAGIVIATLTTNRTLDTLALGAQLLVTTALCWAWIAGAQFWLGSGLFGRGTDLGEFLLGVTIWIAVLLGVRAWLYAVGVSILAHPEENTSTRLRLTSLTMTLLCALGCVVAWGVNGPDDDFLGLGAFIVVLFTLGMISVCTEPEPLSRRMRLDLAEDRGPWRRPLCWLLLPGGGRGFALYLGTLTLLLTLGALAAGALQGSTEEYTGLWTTATISMTHLGLLSWLNSVRPRKPGGPLLRLRLLIVLLPFGLMLLSMLVGVLLDDDAIRQGRSWMNPFYVVIETFDDGLGGDSGPAVVLWSVLASLTLLLNLPRLFAGHREAHQALASAPAKALATVVAAAGGTPASALAAAPTTLGPADDSSTASPSRAALAIDTGDTVGAAPPAPAEAPADTAADAGAAPPTPGGQPAEPAPRPRTPDADGPPA